MSVIENESSYKPSLFLRNGHVNTVYTSLFRTGTKVAFKRQRVITEDNDFIDIDWLKNDGSKLAFLCHGLEGSSDSKYIQHLARQLHEIGYDILAINYRSCSGEINQSKKIYHSGATDDLNFIFTNFTKTYQSITLIGFSLGGNMALKYVGEQKHPLPSNLTSVVAISTPCDLVSSSYEMTKAINRIYTQRFLKTLKEKAKLKHIQFPNLFDLEAVIAAKTVFQFDERFTGPVHGFDGALDYYRSCRANNFIPDIKIPCMIINALDDSFLGDSCYPYGLAEANKNVKLIVSKYGGHVGFAQFKKPMFWHEEKIHEFLKNID